MLVDTIGILSALRMHGLHDKRHLLAKLRICSSLNSGMSPCFYSCICPYFLGFRVGKYADVMLKLNDFQKQIHMLVFIYLLNRKF